MIKKILYFIFFIIFFAQAAYSGEVFKVTSVNFDTANSLIFLTSPDNTTETIMKNVKLTQLQNPKRVYFDINSAVLVAPAQKWFFNSGGIKQVRISQFSTEPARIRVVLFLDEEFDQSKITFLKVNNNIVIKFKDGMCKEDYFQNTYRDEKASNNDFYENLSISNEEQVGGKCSVIAPNTSADQVLGEIQQAFNSNPQPQTTASNIKPVANKTEAIKKELKLKSKYYLNNIEIKPNGFLLSGFGVVGIEKPMYLTEPARVVFDIPNTIVNPDIRNKEFKINQDIIKTGQFGPNKARIVITSNDLEKYYPIFASDGQSVLFLNSENVDIDSLCTKTSDAIGYYTKEIDSKTTEFIIAFNSPIVHSIKRGNSKLTINFYNALRFNEQTFKNTVAPTTLSNMKIDLLPQVGLKLTLPLEKDSIVNCFLGSDGRSVKITVKNVKEKEKIVQSCERPAIITRVNGKRFVVLDAGHGGSDYGAIRAGINEKDITLDVTKRVQAILQSKGVITQMTRNSDETVSLLDRTVTCANASPDIFVSIHVNSSVRPDIYGIETHYYHQNSLDLAQTLHASLISHIKTRDRGLFKSKFYVINHTNVPAILVEIGFISNDAERAQLISEERKQQTAKSIAEGILKYLEK